MNWIEKSKTLNDFFYSGWHFDSEHSIEKNRFQMLNLTIFLSIIAMSLFVIKYTIDKNLFMAFTELSAVTLNMFLLMTLRKTKKYFSHITFFISLEFIFLFFLFISTTPPSALKHIWYFAFPTIIFFFHGKKQGSIWIFFLILSLYLSKILPFIESQYSYAQINYLSFVLLLVSILIYFYQSKMDSDNQIISKQKELLTQFNEQLEEKIKEKTAELKELNAKLESRVEEKVSLLVQKDAMLMNQSRQAAMGEMLSMIAHQWRQPLSTITLQIANLKFNTLLGSSTPQDIDKALDQISNTATYLADTIDDFQNYFKPHKKLETLTISILLEHAINFLKPRIDMYDVTMKTNFSCNQTITTKINEFTQVLINLLNNAIDQLTTNQENEKIITIHVDFHNNTFFIYVKDNGGGIDEKIINQIFDPYFSTKGKNGTGIGLYMSKTIIENQLAGSLSVQNSSEGADFLIKLPKVLHDNLKIENGQRDE